MSDIIKSLVDIGKSSVVLFFGSLIGRGLGLLGFALIVNSLEPQRFGELGLAFTIASVITGIVVFGVQRGLPRLIPAAEDGPEQASLIHSGIVVVGTIGVICAVLLFVLRGTISLVMSEPALIHLLPMFIPYIILQPLSQVSIAGLRGLKYSIQTTLIRDTTAKICGILGFVVLLFIGEPYFGAIVYWSLTPLVVVLLAGGYLVYKLPFNRNIIDLLDSNTYKKLYTFSWPLALEGVMILLMMNIDTLMIGYFLPTEDVGLYKAIQPLAPVILIVLNSLTFLYLPIATEYFEKSNIDDLSSIYKTATKWVVLCSFPMFFVFAIFRDAVVKGFFGSEYLAASGAFAILSFGMFLRTVVGPTGATVKAINRPRVEFVASVSGVLVNIMLNLIFVPLWGIVGAAVATAAGFTIYNTIELGVIYKVARIQPISRNTVKPLILTTIVGLGIASVTSGYRLTLVLLIGIGIIISVTQLVSAYLTRSIDETDKKILNRIKKRQS